MEIKQKPILTKLIRVSVSRHHQLKAEALQTGVTLTKLTENILNEHYNQPKKEVEELVESELTI